MPTISVNPLSSSSINDAISKIREFRKKAEANADHIVQKAAERGKEEAQNAAMYMNAYDSGALVEGIIDEYEDKAGYVKATAPHSAFVEMGTGIVGAQSPNPNSYYPGWRYDVNEHGDAGWWYMGNDGELHWTKGMPSRPYMYEAAQSLKQSIGDIAKGAWEK